MPLADTPPGTTRTKTPATRINTRASSQANFKDLLATQTSIITDYATSLRHLLRKGVLQPGTEPTTDTLSTALFQIAQFPNVPASAIDGIRAVAFLLEKVDATALSLDIQNTLRTSLPETITNHVIAALSPHIASLQDSALALKHPIPPPPRLTPPQDDAPPDITPSPAPAQALEDLLPHVKSIHTTLVTSALAKAEIRARQVLFTPTPDQTLYSKSTDPGTIAIDILDATMAHQNEDAPYINVRSAVCLNNGNLLIELSSAEAAEWMRSTEVRTTLSSSLGINAVVKERTFTVVVPFFPTPLDISDPFLLTNIENENDVPPGSLHSIRWAKNPERR
ncbi:hypothetical protein PISMIDRAFT_105479, partial [Pisolithus microcarpus 441]